MNKRAAKRESIISFYNAIAKEYDRQLTVADEKAREEISVIFRKNVARGTVLDFGSGTGLDFPWLLSSGYEVIALEPSHKMRDIAIERNSAEKIRFVKENLDYKTWTSQQLPFDKKVDGILANFAVLNCIKDTGEFFEKAAIVSKPDAHVVITIINPRFWSVLSNYSLLVALRLFCFGSLMILNKNDGIYHETYLHKLEAIKRASEKYFTVRSVCAIGFSNFVTIAMSKK